MMKLLNRKWVLVSLAIVATLVVVYYVLPKTAWGKKMAEANAAPVIPAAPTAPGTTVPATPAAKLAGNIRYNN